MPTDIQQAKQMLEAKLLETINPAGWRDSIAVRASADPTDTTQHMAERELASRSLDQNASLVRDLRAALGRIDDGTYGICVDCEESIAPRRLVAVPWAARCISCQEEMESSCAEEQLAA